MSRYTHSIVSYSWAWGFDEILNTYFFQKFDNYPADEEDGVVFDIGNRFTLKPHPDYPKKTDFSNRELLKIILEEVEMFEISIPIEHIRAMKSNQPF